MTQELDRRKKSAELRAILATMEVPSFRIQQMSEANLRWISRNIAVKNADHEGFEKATALISEILCLSPGKPW